MNCEQIEVQISGLLDGELTQQETQRVQIHVEDCGHCRQVYQDLKALKAQVGQLDYPSADTQMLEDLESDLTAKFARRSGFLLLIIGFALAIGFGLFTFFTDPSVPLIVQLCYGLYIVGGLALFISVLRQRLKTYKNDKYRKVDL